jgi:hypothetical protein
VRRSIVVLIVLSSCLFAVCTGCASLTERCATVLLQSMAQVCVDVICDEGEDGEIVDVPEEKRRVVREEPPAPDWRPSEGECDIVRGDDGVTVSCADGTRASFARAGEGAPPPLAEQVPDEHECRVVRQGVDVDGDGALSSTELVGRTLDCARGPTLQGHLAIQSPEDVARLAGRRALTGGLHVSSAGLTRLEVPQLQSMGGTLRVDGGAALEVLVLPSLARVGGDVVISHAAALQTIAVPALAHVGGSVIAVENPQLPQATVEEVVFRLSRHGFAGPVELAGNRP